MTNTDLHSADQYQFSNIVEQLPQKQMLKGITSKAASKDLALQLGTVSSFLLQKGLGNVKNKYARDAKYYHDIKTGKGMKH